MQEGRIRHATEKFVNNLIDNLKKLIEANGKQINVLSTARGYLTTVQCPNNHDFNLLTKNGKYKIWQGIHAPMSGDRGWLIDVIAENDTNVSQKATSFFPEALSFERSNISGTWSPWEEKVSINDLSTFNIVPTFAGGASGYEGGEIHFIHPPNESQYFTNNAIVQDIVGKTMRFYATTSQGAKLAVIDFESLPVGSATIATTSKTDILPNTGWSIAVECASTYVISGNILTYNALLIGDGTNRFPIQLPMPKRQDGSHKWYAGCAISQNGNSKYLTIQPDGWLNFQGGYEPHVAYAITVSYPI